MEEAFEVPEKRSFTWNLRVLLKLVFGVQVLLSTSRFTVVAVHFSPFTDLGSKILMKRCK